MERRGEGADEVTSRYRTTALEVAASIVAPQRLDRCECVRIHRNDAMLCYAMLCYAVVTRLSLSHSLAANCDVGLVVRLLEGQVGWCGGGELGRVGKVV